MRKTKAIGIAFICISLLGLIGWIGGIDPYCYYTTDLFIQYRFCEEGHTDPKQPLDYTIPITLIATLAFGILLLKIARHQISQTSSTRK